MTDIGKASLRDYLSNKRLALNHDDIRHKSRLIYEQLVTVVDWPKVRSLHCFTTIQSLNEPGTEPLFRFIWGNHPKIQTYTTQKIEGHWRHGLIDDGGFTAVISLPEMDMIFVPLLGFDKQNNRLGYGGGFYDKFLVSQPQAKKIGLAFEVSRVNALPTESHDVPLDLVITESGKQ